MEIRGKTRLTGVCGYPVRHSLSPVFQNAAFLHEGIDCVYVPMEVKPAHIKEAVAGIRALDFVGVNFTIPHKRAVIECIDDIDPEAARLGSVNTVVNINGKLKGYTTDGCGFTRSLREDGGFHPGGKNIFMLGAGGSSYAIAGALAAEKAARLLICNRTIETAQKLGKYLSGFSGFDDVVIVPFEERNKREYWKDVSLLVNTTPVGMKQGDPCLVDVNNLDAGILVYDIIYNRKTELLKQAEESGIKCLDGISMLIYQGAVSFEIWTGSKAPVDAMKKSLEERSVC